MSLRRGVEQQLATRRAVEHKQLALTGMVNEQSILQGRIASDHNAENKRRLRVGRQENAEIEREMVRVLDCCPFRFRHLDLLGTSSPAAPPRANTCLLIMWS